MTPLLTKEDDPIETPPPPPKMNAVLLTIFPTPIKSCNVMQKSQAK